MSAAPVMAPAEVPEATVGRMPVASSAWATPASNAVAGGGDMPITIVPLGAADLLARALGIPVGDPAAAAGVAVDGEGRTTDVVELVGSDDHAVLMVDAGFDALLVRDADRGNKDGLGPCADVAAGIQNLFELEQVEFELDGDVQRAQGHTALCSNIGRVGDTVVVDSDQQANVVWSTCRKARIAATTSRAGRR